MLNNKKVNNSTLTEGENFELVEMVTQELKHEQISNYKT
jgi:hypothetical protein